MSEFEDFWNNHKDGFLAAVLNLGVAIAILIIGLIVIRLVMRFIRYAFSHSKNPMDETLANFLCSIIKFLLKFILFIMVIARLGIDTASFVAVIFSMTLALAFALQGMMANFAAGFMLISFRPFKVGDLVTVAGQHGKVQEIGMFNTTLVDWTRNVLVVANGSITSDTIINHTHKAEAARRVDLVFGISYSDDINKALDCVRAVLKHGDDLILQDPAPEVGVESLGGSEVNLQVRPWCSPHDYLAVKHKTLHRVKEALDAGGFTIPFPQRDVHLFKESDVQEGGKVE